MSYYLTQVDITPLETETLTMQLKAPEMCTLPGQACHPVSDKECIFPKGLKMRCFIINLLGS